MESSQERFAEGGVGHELTRWEQRSFERLSHWPQVTQPGTGSQPWPNESADSQPITLYSPHLGVVPS